MQATRIAPAFDPGTVWFVGAGPGDPGLLTLHGLHALQQADIILHDALVAPDILRLASATALLEPVGKRAGRASPNQLEINQRLIDLARDGRRVLRLKGGDPFVFGRGGEEALALAAAGIAFRIVPGVTAGIGGAAYAGIPATHRGIAQAMTFVTGHAAAGHEPKGVDWQGLARSSSVLVLYMALRRIDRIAAMLIEGGRRADEPAALISEASTPAQLAVRTTLQDLPRMADGLAHDRPTLIVIGPVVELGDVLSAWQQTSPMRIEPAPAEAPTQRTPRLVQAQFQVMS